MALSTLGFWGGGCVEDGWLDIAAAQTEDGIEPSRFPQQPVGLIRRCLFVGPTVDLKRGLRK